MSGDDAWIAIDWGTTNRRAYLIDGTGRATNSFGDDQGILSVPAEGYPQSLAEVRDRFGDAPLRVVAAGMVGSDRGWRSVPYVDAPASLAAIAAGACEIAPDTWIVPGVAYRSPSRADVMRGEEVQVLGAVCAGLADADTLFCQPGTHSKWIVVENGCIAGFSTAMTGELFGLLRHNGILAGMLDGAVGDGDVFRAGVRRGAGARDLAAALFEVRSGVLLGRLPPADAASFASGVLIGADVGAHDLDGREVALLASGPLAALYAIAVEMRGGSVRAVDSHAAFLAGIGAVHERLQ